MTRIQQLDDNGRTISEGLLFSQVTKSLTASNETAAVPIFRLTGSVEVRSLFAVVTTIVGSNHTAAYFRLNDQTAQSDITLSTGTTISSAAVGSLLVKKGLAGAALTLLTSAQERVSEPTTLETSYFSPFVIVAKPAANTDIEYVYSTTQTPTTGAIQFFIRWLPLSAGSGIATV